MPIWEWLLESAAGVLLLVLVLGVALIIRRRWLSRHGGTFELSYRARASQPGRGWLLGLGRYTGDRLEWFRIFSLSPRPKLVWQRATLNYVERRDPEGVEQLSLYPGHVVIRCETPAGDVELALGPSSLMGFQSWLEAGPAGRPPPVTSSAPATTARNAVAAAFALNGLCFATLGLAGARPAGVARPDQRRPRAAPAVGRGRLDGRDAGQRVPDRAVGRRRRRPARAAMVLLGLVLAGVFATPAPSSVRPSGCSATASAPAPGTSAMNVEGAAVEQMLGRSIMPRFHAGWSFGTFTGARLGAVAAALGVPLAAHYSSSASWSSVGGRCGLRGFLPRRRPSRPTDDGAPAAARPGWSRGPWRSG